MNPRRALTATAVAALLVPAALAAGPAALAADVGGASDGPPTATATPSAPATPEETVPGTEPPTDRPSSSAPPTTSSPPEPSPSDSTSPSLTGEPTAPSPSGSGQPSAPPDVPAVPSATPSHAEGTDRDAPGGVCDAADFDVRVSGWPASAAAGTTTEPFTVVLDNSTGGDAARVRLGLSVALRDGQRDADWTEAGRHVSVRYYDWNARTWRTASETGGIHAYVDVEAGLRYRMRLRLVVGPDTPGGAAGALVSGTWWAGDRASGAAGSGCVQDSGWYPLTVSRTGPAPGSATVRPQGAQPSPPRHAGARSGPEAVPEGALARTGPGRQVPVVTVLSVGTVLVGVTAMWCAARRRSRG